MGAQPGPTGLQPHLAASGGTCARARTQPRRDPAPAGRVDDVDDRRATRADARRRDDEPEAMGGGGRRGRRGAMAAPRRQRRTPPRRAGSQGRQGRDGGGRSRAAGRYPAGVAAGRTSTLRTGVPATPQRRSHSARYISMPRAAVMSPRSRIELGRPAELPQQLARPAVFAAAIVAGDEHRVRALHERRVDHHRRRHGVERLDDAHVGQRALDLLAERVVVADGERRRHARARCPAGWRRRAAPCPRAARSPPSPAPRATQRRRWR